MKALIAGLVAVGATSAPVRAQDAAPKKTYESMVRFEIEHLDIIETAPPVPIEAAAAAHAVEVHVKAAVLEVRAQDQRDLQPRPGETQEAYHARIRQQSGLTPTELRAVCDVVAARFTVAARPAERSARVTEVEVRYRAADPGECVAATKEVAAEYQKLLDELDSDDTKELDKLQTGERELEEGRKYFESKGEAERAAAYAKELKWLRARIDLLRLKNRVGRFVVTVTERPEKAIEVATP